MKKLFFLFSLIFISSYIYGQGVDCTNADPFCTGTSYDFPASVGVPNLGTVGCLGTTPNPAWYWMQIANPGNINIHMSSADASGTGHDVDFICWGPFPSLSAACASSLMTNSGVDCSYSTAAQEDCYIPNAQTGQVYVLLITNYANAVTNITFNQTSGGGSTNCGIIAPPITGDTVCVGETIQLTVNSPAAGATYAWTGPNSWSSTDMNPTIPGATTAMSGTYSLTITIGPDVSPPVTCNVIVNPNPTVSITPSSPSTCPGIPVTLTGNCNGPLPQYFWTTSETGNPITVAPTTTTAYAVTSIDANGCSGTAYIEITVNPDLVISVTPPAPMICIGGSINLTASGGETYTWTPSTSLSCSDCASPVASPLVTTTYTVTGMNAGGCSGTTTVTVAASAGPNFNVYQSKPVVCRGDTCTISVNGGSNISWSPIDGLSSGSGNTVIASPMSTMTYTIIGDNNGCLDTANVTVTVVPTPEINFTANVTEGCENLEVHFSDLTHPAIASWAWNFGDQSSINLTNFMQNPVHMYQESGIFDVSLTGVSAEGCVGYMYVPQMIVVHKNPVADFIYNPMVTDELDRNVWFNDESVNAISWAWDFGENYTLGNNSSSPNPEHEYSGVGTYIVTLAVESEFGCVDTVRKPVIIEPLITFYAPSSFTPNNDGLNDVYLTYGYGIDETTFEMRIFDRWGQEIFFTPDINKGWDGRVSGDDRICHVGIYVYMVSFKDVKGNLHQEKGTIQLYR